MSEMIRILVLMGELTVLSIQDIRQRRIWVPMLAVMLTVAAGIVVWDGRMYGEVEDLHSMVVGILFGIVMLAAGHFTGAIGEGDGMVLILIALMARKIPVIAIFLLAMTTASITALFLLVLGKVQRKYEMPFIPFLLFSLIGVVVCT